MTATVEKRCAFSLVEVVLALGVVSFALVAIMGVFPIGLQTARTAQDETRAAQIAQGIFASMAAQAVTQFTNLQIPVSGTTTLPAMDLTQSSTPTNPQLYADNNGNLAISSTGMIYAITISTKNNPAGFAAPDAGLASEVMISIGWPAKASAANQTKRNFVRIISKY